MLSHMREQNNMRPYYIQLFHLENQINRNKLRTNQAYKEVYNSIRKNNANWFSIPNANVNQRYTRLVNEGRKLYNITMKPTAAQTIQRAYRKHLLKNSKGNKMVIMPGGNKMLARRVISPRRKASTAAAARKIANEKEHNRYLNMLRQMN
jgi:hypothetical protein